MNFLSRIFKRGLSCHQVEAVMQEYLDGELTPEEVPKVLKHLETCRDCGLEIELYERIKVSLTSHQQDPDQASVDKIRALAHELATSGPPETDDANIG